MSELTGQVAWMNGGAGAVGVAVCAELARAGAHVVVSGRSAAAGLECVNGIRATSISPAGIDTPLLDKRPKPGSAVRSKRQPRPA